MSEKKNDSGKPITLTDDGFAEVQIGSECCTVDVWDAYWKVVGAHEDGIAPLEYTARIRAVMAEIGFAGKLSGVAVDRFADAIVERVKTLKKKEEPTSASPG